MVAEMVPPYTERGERNDYHALSRGWDLNRRSPERNPQASALDHSAARPHPLLNNVKAG